MILAFQEVTSILLLTGEFLTTRIKLIGGRSNDCNRVQSYR